MSLRLSHAGRKFGVSLCFPFSFKSGRISLGVIMSPLCATRAVVSPSWAVREKREKVPTAWIICPDFGASPFG